MLRYAPCALPVLRKDGELYPATAQTDLSYRVFPAQWSGWSWRILPEHILAQGAPVRLWETPVRFPPPMIFAPVILQVAVAVPI